MPQSSPSTTSQRCFANAEPHFFAGTPFKDGSGRNPFEDDLRSALATRAHSGEAVAAALTSYISHTLTQPMISRPSSLYAEIAMGVQARLCAHHTVEGIMRYVDEQIA